MNLKVKRVERITADVPFHDVPARNMIRELPHWAIFEICKVMLEGGVVGFGETMQYYTRGPVSETKVKQVVGRNAAESMWDDSLGAGLQMALFDAVGRAMEVPCYALLGQKHRDQAFISWWDIDMPASDWALECQGAMAQGYSSFKTKARPWFDLNEQCRILCESLPPHFELDLDFNGMLLDTAHGTRILTRVQNYPNVAI